MHIACRQEEVEIPMGRSQTKLNLADNFYCRCLMLNLIEILLIILERKLVDGRKYVPHSCHVGI
jgi:hypothetical protein